jgi:hypothetical protein
MGTGMEIPLIMAAVAGGTSYVNTQRTAKKQDQTAAEGIRQQGVRQREADAKVRELIEKTRTSGPEGERKSALEKYMQALGVQAPNAQASFTDVAGASDAYGADVNAARSGVTDYGAQIADLMARIDAPADQRRREGNTMNRFDTDINQIKRFSSGDDFLNQLKLQSIRRNPFLDAVSTAAQAFGSSYTGGYGGAGATTGGSAGLTGPMGFNYATGKGLNAAGFPTMVSY